MPGVAAHEALKTPAIPASLEPGTPVTAVHCAEEVWTARARQHPDIAAHEAAIRTTIRDPDAVYDDRHSTAQRQPTLGREAAMRHYLGRSRIAGHPAALLTAVVMVLRDPATGAEVGYVQTMYRTRRVLPRLQLRWSRQP